MEWLFYQPNITIAVPSVVQWLSILVGVFIIFYITSIFICEGGLVKLYHLRNNAKSMADQYEKLIWVSGNIVIILVLCAGIASFVLGLLPSFTSMSGWASLIGMCLGIAATGGFIWFMRNK